MYKKETRGSFHFTLLKVSFDNSAIQIDRTLRERSNSLNEFLPVPTALLHPPVPVPG